MVCLFFNYALSCYVLKDFKWRTIRESFNADDKCGSWSAKPQKHHATLTHIYITPYAVSEKIMGHKRGKLSVHCGMQKAPEATFNSEKIKPVAFAVIELRLSEGFVEKSAS